MAQRFYSEFTSEHGIDYIVQVWDTAFVGTPIEFNLGAGGFQLSYTSDTSERTATIFASQVEFTFYVQNGFHLSFETALIQANEGRFAIKIFREGDLYWVGQILPDIIDILDQPTIHGRPLIIRATDGLGRLKDIDYNDDGAAYIGTDTFIGHLFNCLNKINIFDLMATDCVKTSVGWEEDSAAAGDPLVLTRVKHKAFIKVDDKGTLTYKTCADIIKEILGKFQARIIQVDGCFHCFQVGQYVDNSMTVYAYDSTGTGTGNVSSQTFQQTDNASAGDMIRLSGGRFTYFPALKDVQLEYKHFTTQNLSFDRQISTGTTYNILSVPSGGISSVLVFNLQIRTKLEFDDPNNFDSFYVKYNLRIQIGSYYYRRVASINNRGIITYGKADWVTSPGDYEIFTPAISADNYDVYNDIYFTSKPIPDDGDLTIRLSHLANYTGTGNVTGRTDFTRTTQVNDVYIEIVTAGVIQDRVQTTTYSAENTNTDLSVTLKTESVIGDGVEPQTYGALEVYNGSDWVSSDFWTGLGESTPTPLLQLLVNELLSGQSKPTQRIESTWEATGYKANMSILYNTNNYLPLQCKLDAGSDIWSGEFFAVVRALSEASAQTPKKRLASPGDYIKRLDTTKEVPVPSPIVEPITRRVGVLVVSDEMPRFVSGDTVGSIPILETIYDKTFLDGDTIYLVNNNTGQIQNFTVSGDVPIGANFLNVYTEAADFDIIPGAVVLPDFGYLNSRINTATGGGSSYFQQEFDNHMSSTLTWTENGGVLPASNTKAQVQLFQGQSKLREGVHYTISGSNFIVDSNVHYNGAYYEAIVII